MERLNAQFGHPSGFIGWLVGQIMALEHRKLTRWAVRSAGASARRSRVGGRVRTRYGHRSGWPHDSARRPRRYVAGVDLSRGHGAAGARHATHAAIREGRVDLRQGSAVALPFDAGIIHPRAGDQLAGPLVQPGRRAAGAVARAGARRAGGHRRPAPRRRRRGRGPAVWRTDAGNAAIGGLRHGLYGPRPAIDRRWRSCGKAGPAGPHRRDSRRGPAASHSRLGVNPRLWSDRRSGCPPRPCRAPGRRTV